MSAGVAPPDGQSGPSAGAGDGEEGSAPRDDRFDPLAYYQSTKHGQKSVRGLVALLQSGVRLVRLASPRLLIVVAVLQLGGAALLGAQVIFGKLALERLLQVGNTGVGVGRTALPLAGLVLAAALAAFATVAQTQLQRLLGEYVQRLAWDSILRVTTAVPLETFESSDFFDDLQRVRTMAVIQPLTLTQNLLQMVGGVIGAVALCVAVFAIEPLLLPVLLLSGIPLSLLSRRTGRIEFDFMVRQTTSVRLRAYFTEILCGRDEAKEIRAFGLGDHLRERWSGNYASYITHYRRHILRRLRLSLLSALTTAVATGLTLGLLLLLVDRGRLSLAGAGAGLLAVRVLGGRVQQLFAGVSGLFESSLFLRDLERFLQRAPAGAQQLDPSVEPFRELVVEDVHFRYPGSSRDVVQGISLSIKAGEVVALVGENGSGKTTLAKLLAGLYEPTQGRILWDGREAHLLDPEERRRHAGVIFQDYVRYQMTARDNITLGRVDDAQDTERMRSAARDGGAAEYVERLPEGYETGLGKEWFGGFDLSGGQWQRLALSRAFFRGAEFLILDEPTASLDAQSEHDLFQRVRELTQDRSLLLISHRFSTVRVADRILVLDDGRVVESGNHDELMALGGRYASLFELQAGAYR